MEWDEPKLAGNILRWTWRLIHMKCIARMPETIFMCNTKELFVHLSCNFYEVHGKFKYFEIHMNFIYIQCELFMSLMSTSFVLHGYDISPSFVLRHKIHMNFIRTACKFIWINLILFLMELMRSSCELHMKFIWTPHKFHMNKFDFISYEIHEKFMWTSYEVHNKFLCSSNKFRVKLCIYSFIWTSYGWASRSIVTFRTSQLLLENNVEHRGPFYWNRLTSIPTWKRNHMPPKVWDEIT